MILRNHEFSFSSLNANDVERMEAAQAKAQAMSEAEQARYAREKTPYAEILRSQCRILTDYFDTLLGEGASALLGLDGNDLGACVKFSREFAAAMEAEKTDAAAMVKPLGTLENTAMAAAPALCLAPQNRSQRRRSKHRRHG